MPYKAVQQEKQLQFLRVPYAMKYQLYAKAVSIMFYIGKHCVFQVLDKSIAICKIGKKNIHCNICTFIELYHYMVYCVVKFNPLLAYNMNVDNVLPEELKPNRK